VNKFPGTGVAFGLDRIMVYMEEKGMLKNLKRNTEVLVANFPDTLKENLDLVIELQKNGINTELYLNDANLKKQFKYADKKAIPWMIIQGSEEVKKKKVALRNMVTGKQEFVTAKQVIKKLANKAS
jgi:histidyl-tRNA synthetase